MMHDRLEGDDVIAISVKKILSECIERKITIITSDKDYLQLLQPSGNVSIFNAALKNIGLTKDGSFIDGRKELFIKTVMGDKSDNIHPAITKCGYKTAEKCYHDRVYFESRLDKEGARQAYANNKKLVDFDEIPANLVEEFWCEYCSKVIGLL
jgi:5'-3' exonuclease